MPALRGPTLAYLPLLPLGFATGRELGRQRQPAALPHTTSSTSTLAPLPLLLPATAHHAWEQLTQQYDSMYQRRPSWTQATSRHDALRAATCLAPTGCPHRLTNPPAEAEAAASNPVTQRGLRVAGTWSFMTLPGRWGQCLQATAHLHASDATGDSLLPKQLAAITPYLQAGRCGHGLTAHAPARR